MTTIKIISAPDEVLAWKRSITMEFNGKQVYMRLWWDEYNGFEYIEPDFSGNWTDEETKAFYDWRNAERTDGWGSNLLTLDELTSDDKDFGTLYTLED